MILLIDIGNTTVYIGLSKDDTLLRTFHLLTDVMVTSDEYYFKLQHFLKDEHIEAVMLSSVVPALTVKFKDLLNKYYTCEVIVLEQPIKTKIQLKADNPKEVGGDLIACAAGLEIDDVLIIDLGTATKYIYVKNKTIHGVSIAPGVEKSLHCLVSSAALLPSIELKAPNKLLGNNSITAMQSGIIYGMACQIDGMITRIRAEVKSEFKVIATGGLAQLIIPLCSEEILIDEELIMKGLIKIYSLNRRTN